MATLPDAGKLITLRQRFWNPTYIIGWETKSEGFLFTFPDDRRWKCGKMSFGNRDVRRLS